MSKKGDLEEAMSRIHRLDYNIRLDGKRPKTDAEIAVTIYAQQYREQGWIWNPVTTELTYHKPSKE